jgi:hypothetical protein
MFFAIAFRVFLIVLGVSSLAALLLVFALARMGSLVSKQEEQHSHRNPL